MVEIGPAVFAKRAKNFAATQFDAVGYLFWQSGDQNRPLQFWISNVTSEIVI